MNRAADWDGCIVDMDQFTKESLVQEIREAGRNVVVISPLDVPPIGADAIEAQCVERESQRPMPLETVSPQLRFRRRVGRRSQ